MGKRLIWTNDEQRTVMAEVLRIKREASDFISQPRLLSMAQTVLVVERRAMNRASSFTSNFFKKMKQIEDSGHADVIKHVPHVVNAAPITAPTAPAEPDAPMPIIVVERKVIVKELPDYGKISTVTLARIMLERLSRLEETEAALLNMRAAFDSKREVEKQYDRRLDPRPEPQQPKDEPLRICIVGVQPKQRIEIEEKIVTVSKPLKVKFYDTDHEGEQFPTLVDFIILSRFISHKWSDKAKATLPADCVFFVETVQGIIQKVFDLAARQIHPALAGKY